MKHMVLLTAGFALITMLGAGCSRVMTDGQASGQARDQSVSASAAAAEESVAESTNPCNASMSWGTGVRRYFGDCNPRTRILP